MGIRSKKIPIYKQIVADIKQQIAAGDYKIGDMLPSENDYCKQYQTTRVTIRQAINELISIGLVQRYHGKGSYVSEAKNALGILSVRGVTAGVGNLNLKTIIVKKPELLAWPDNFFFNVGEVHKKLGCIHFSRVRTLEGKPIIFEETFITNHQLEVFLKTDLENKSLFNFLKNSFNIDIKGGEQKIWAVMANEEVAKLLSLTEKHPVLHMKRNLKTSDSKVEIFSFLYCNTEQYYLHDSF
ncbi:MAG TPA: GntR family transcriptional regulator [Pelobium sp.]